MKNIFLLILVSTLAGSLLKAVASEVDQLLILNYAVSKDAKNAALAAYPFIPAGSIKQARFAIKKQFADVQDADLKHKSELADEAAIIAQAKVVADKHAPLLERAGYKKS